MMSRVSTWPLERVLFGLAGTLTLVSVLLAVTVSIWFVALAGFVALNQWLFAAAGACPASILLRRTCKLRSALDPSPERSTSV